MTLSVIIPVHNAAAGLRCCLTAVCASRNADDECIVVDDGSTDDSAAIAAAFPVRLIRIASPPRGPAAARNRGAAAARGDVLLFVDADVVVHPDTLSVVAATFAERPDVEAVFGSYDDRPADRRFLSQYKNLFHHFVHQQAREEAATFWSGCGAIRRQSFAALGGFDEARHPRSSGEDIELGYRLRAAGRKVLLLKRLQVRHLKRWTLWGLVASDVTERALPWTRLILERRSLPNDLNLRVSQRLCGLLTTLLVLYLGVAAWVGPGVRIPVALLLALAAAFLLAVGHWPRPPEGLLFDAVVLSFGAAAVALVLRLPWPLGAPVLAAVLLVVLANRGIVAFFARKRGVVFTLAAIPFLLCYYLYGVAAFGIGGVLFLAKRSAV